jgi:hypothetical protein
VSCPAGACSRNSTARARSRVLRRRTIWTSYAQARQANPAAYDSAATFAANDAVTHAAALGRRPVRVASGYSDPFYPGVRALARAWPALGGTAVLDFGPGCHDGSFFAAQEPPSLAFLASHLAS